MIYLGIEIRKLRWAEIAYRTMRGTRLLCVQNFGGEMFINKPNGLSRKENLR